MTPSPLVRDGTRVSLFTCSSKISWLLSIIFSVADCCCWSAAITRTIFTVLIVSRERDLDASVTTAAAAAAVAARPAPLVPFSLLRREELRCQRCFSLEEVLRRLGRFTDSALALKPVATLKRISMEKVKLPASLVRSQFSMIFNNENITNQKRKTLIQINCKWHTTIRKFQVYNVYKFKLFYK